MIGLRARFWVFGCVVAVLALLAPGAHAQPFNDAFADAVVIQTGQVLNGTNNGATKEPGEPDHGDDGGGSVWWKFTPTVSKGFVLDLAGTNYSAIAGIYTGNAVDDLTPVGVASNPDSRPRITFNATANTTYYIAVDGFKSGSNAHATGNIQIRINRVLIVTPEGNVSFEGPEGGPFTPASVDFTLTAPAGPIDVFINNSSSWGDLSNEEVVQDLHTTPVTITLTPNSNAHGREPGLYVAQVQFSLAAGPGSEVRNIFLFVEPPSEPPDNDLLVDFGRSGLHQRMNNTSWLKVHNNTPGTVATGDLDGDGQDEVIASFAGFGLYVRHNNANPWTRIHTVVPTRIVTGDFDGDGRDDLAGDFGADLLVRINNGAWVRRAAASQGLAVGDLDDDGKADLIGDFGAGGLRARYNNAGGWVALNAASPVHIAVGDLDGDGRGDVIADFGPGPGKGIQVRYNNANPWRVVQPAASQGLAVGDLDGNGLDEILGDFSNGLRARYNNAGAWVLLHGTSPVRVITADLDSSGRDEVVADFGGTTGIAVRYNNAAPWRVLHRSREQAMAAGGFD
jgi:hypothetical protein